MMIPYPMVKPRGEKGHEEIGRLRDGPYVGAEVYGVGHAQEEHGREEDLDTVMLSHHGRDASARHCPDAREIPARL